MAEITLYNTRTRTKEPFVPLDPPNVRMYVCGPTVYDRAHIGNARPVVVFDTLFRLLRHVYGAEHVRYVRNITDVEDKINARALASGREISEITEETIRWYHEDMAALGALPPSEEPRATAYIAEMVAMIVQLIARGHAYPAEGHVLFDVKSYPAYGRFSHRSLDEMQAGARVEVAPYKRDPMDFVLWKPSPEGTPGWPSPWGRGRPGWHIECSAMSEALLGTSFDIHGGGIDLLFPHHENEIAQSLCAHPGSTFANVWMHNGFLNVEGEKMSKSLGNFFTVRDLLDRGIPGEVIRFVLLSTHYRQPIDWTESKVEEAKRTLNAWRTISANSQPLNVSSKVVDALSDDLNTPLAISYLHELANIGNGADLIGSANLVGLLSPPMGDWFRFGEIPVSDDARLLRILDIRNEARKSKNYSLSDFIRNRANLLGISIMDTKEGSAIFQSYDFLVRQRNHRLRELCEDGNLEAAKEFAEDMHRFGVSISLVNGKPSAYRRDQNSDWQAEVDKEIDVLLQELEHQP